MLVVDSTVWINYFNGIVNPQTDYLHAAIEHTTVLVGDLMLVEVLQGFRKDDDFEKVRRALGKLLQANMVSPAMAVQSARNNRFLRQKGVTVRKMIDNLIATFCLENDHELLHNDSDFDGYEQHLGLRVVHP